MLFCDKLLLFDLNFWGLEFWLTEGLIDGLTEGLTDGLFIETRGDVALAFEKLLDMLVFYRRAGLLIWGGLYGTSLLLTVFQSTLAKYGCSFIS